MMIDIKPKSFISKVYELLEKYQLEEVEVYKKVDISRKLFSKLRNPEYHPGKQTIFKLILGMNLSFKDAKELLEHGGYSFSRSNKQDLVIEYCVINKIFDLIDVNIILNDLDLEIL